MRLGELPCYAGAVKAAALAVSLALVGCAKGGPLDPDGAPAHRDAPAGGGSGRGSDGPAADIDAPAGTADAPAAHDAPVHAPGTHLLLSEVVLQPSVGEFIEIVNPTPATVDLSTYYLADNGNYWKLPQHPASTDSGDFIAQFPAGATIAPGGVVVVALDTTANFLAKYGAAPTYSIASATMTVKLATGTPSLTNAGELVVLFQMDPGATTVHDVDMLLAGQPTAANGLVAKTGTGYKPDAMTLANQAAAPGASLSTKRLALEAGHEPQTGAGNGITGDDETAEDTAATWDQGSFTAPTPGVVPAALTP